MKSMKPMKPSNENNVPELEFTKKDIIIGIGMFVMAVIIFLYIIIFN